MSPGSDTDPGLASDSGERYERGERIATGGMGEVWRARDTVLGREVAVKILKRELADDPTFRARFAAEAKHAAGLHHPGIASVFDYGLLSEGMPYLVMELVDGKPLSDLLAGGRGVDPEQARMLALQTADALAVAHAAGVIHRDIKPANMLVTPDGRVKITDFGIARAVDSVAYTQTGQIVGTPQYLSPEQARGNAATAASDVYALGIVLFECLAGHRPFTADTPIATALAQIQQDVPALPETVPAPLAEVVMRALAKDPRERYADGAEMAAALRAAGGEGPPVPPPTIAPAAAALADPTQVQSTGQGAAVADDTDDDPDFDPDEPEEGRRSRWPLYAGGLLALALLVALLVARPWTQDGTNPSDEGDTVSVRRADYVGRAADEAVAALEDQGLQTVTETRENPGDQDTDTVADLNPTGQVDAGATITLQVWGDRPAPEPTQDEPAPDPDPQPTENNEQDDPGNQETPGTEGTEPTPEDPGNEGTPEDQGNQGEPTDPGNEPAPGDEGGPGNGEGTGEGNGAGNGNGAGRGEGNGNGNGNGNGGDPPGQTIERGDSVPGAVSPDTAGSPQAAVPTQTGEATQTGGAAQTGGAPGKNGG